MGLRAEHWVKVDLNAGIHIKVGGVKLSVIPHMC